MGLGAAGIYSCGASTPSTSAIGPLPEGGATSSDASTPDGNATSSDGSTSSTGCASATGNDDHRAAVVAAVDKLLAAVTPDQKTAIQYAKTLANAQQWSNFPAGVVKRNGVKLGDMSADAQAAAEALAGVAAGPVGAKLLAEVRAADDESAGGSSNPSLFGRGNYYVSIHGTASADAAWMLQFAGHHLAYNFTYGGKCVSATPFFDGVEPSNWVDSNAQAHAPLESQRAATAALLASVGALPDAKLSGTFADMINGPAPLSGGNGGNDTKYPSKLTYPTGTTGRGASVGTFSADQKALVKTAIETWVTNVADPMANALLAAYESDAALAETYVGYSGATDLSANSSYARIDGPRLWIEFTVQTGTATTPQGHYHTIWRDKVADYGADYISQ